MSERALLSSFWVRPYLPRFPHFTRSTAAEAARCMRDYISALPQSDSLRRRPRPRPPPPSNAPCRAPAALRDSTADVDMLIVGCRTLLRPEENPNVKHTQATLAAHPVHPAIPKLQVPDLLKLLGRHCVELQDAIEHDDEEQSTRISTLLACMAIRAQVTAITAS